MSKGNIAQLKPRGCDSSFKKDHKEAGGLQSLTPRVDFKPETKPGSPPTFVYSRETSDIATPVSAHTLRLLEAVREGNSSRKNWAT